MLIKLTAFQKKKEKYLTYLDVSKIFVFNPLLVFFFLSPHAMLHYYFVSFNINIFTILVWEMCFIVSRFVTFIFLSLHVLVDLWIGLFFLNVKELYLRIEFCIFIVNFKLLLLFLLYIYAGCLCLLNSYII